MTGSVYLIVRHEITEWIDPIVKVAEVTPHGYYSNHCEDIWNNTYDIMVVNHTTNNIEERFDIKIEFDKRDDSKGSIWRWFKSKEGAIKKLYELAETKGLVLPYRYDEEARMTSGYMPVIRFRTANGKLAFF